MPPDATGTRTVIFTIIHRTTYRYRQPVTLNPHQLLLRPRDGIALRVLSHELVATDAIAIRQYGDVHGNTKTTASFARPADTLVIEARTLVEKTGTEWPVFDIAATAITYPFEYDQGTRQDLGAMLSPAYPDPERQLATWASGFVLSSPTDTLSLLNDLSAGISNALIYEIRDAEGTQSPQQSLTLGRGTCRDFAVLFADAARHLGFGSRLVSGYLYSDDAVRTSSATSETTHAWAEIFLPGAGWVAFDPTNRQLGDFNLIAVAVGTDIERLMPVTGSFAGPDDALLAMEVEVHVSRGPYVPEI